MSESGRTIRTPQAQDGDSPGSNEPCRPEQLGSFPFPKRSRVTVACQRCKSRKQKCDGLHPSCTRCSTENSNCHYPTPTRSTVSMKGQYIKVLEGRVAELEKALAASKDQTSKSTPPPIPESNNPSLFMDNPEDEQMSLGIVDVLRNLSLDASGGYLGSSSTISMGRLVADIIKQRGNNARDFVREKKQSYPSDEGSPQSINAMDSPTNSISMEPISLPPEVAHRLLDGYFQHVSTRWPVLHSAQILDWHSRRDSIDDVVERTLFYLVYANAARYLETTGATGNFIPSSRYYFAALEYLEDVLQFQDMRAIQVLLLLGIYSLRAPRGPGTWSYVRLAMQICIEQGFHRKVPDKVKHTMAYQMKSRVFWTCYMLDRLSSITLGRPFSIPDRDIDADLPLDIDENCEEITIDTRIGTKDSSTSLSCFCHTIRMRQLESSIQQEIYRVDVISTIPNHKFEYFIAKLASWKSEIPSPNSTESYTYPKPDDSLDYYLHFYYNSLRLLLYPQISSSAPEQKYIAACADACVEVCNTFKRLHHNVVVGYSVWALQTVFLAAGLTLLLCIWRSPKETYTLPAQKALNSCSILLYVITERWPRAKRYRDTFEDIKQWTVDIIEEDKNPSDKRLVTRPSLPQEFNIAEDGVVQQLLDIMNTDDPAVDLNHSPQQNEDVFVGLEVDPLSFQAPIDWNPSFNAANSEQFFLNMDSQRTPEYFR